MTLEDDLALDSFLYDKWLEVSFNCLECVDTECSYDSCYKLWRYFL